MSLPLPLIQSIARGLVYVAPELRQQAWSDMAPGLGVTAANLDNEFARVEQNYPAERCAELAETQKVPAVMRRSAYCCGAEAHRFVLDVSDWGH